MNGDSWVILPVCSKPILLLVVHSCLPDVDSKIELTLDFDECPLEGAADIDGETRVGLQIACSDNLADQATAEEKLLAKSLAQIAIDTHDVDQTTYSTAALYQLHKV